MGRLAPLFAVLVPLAIAIGAWFMDGQGSLSRGLEAGTPSGSTDEPVTPATKPAIQASRPMAGKGFDFYVLSLSWSPTYCDSDAGRNNRAQCGTGKRFGWVVHGLWPQYERGYPQDCESAEGSRVPDAMARGIIDIMPGIGLIGHQWRKHGSCSGLPMADYFALVRQVHDKILIPPQFSSVREPLQTSPATIEQAFIRSNPGLTRSAVAVTCDSQRVDEVRICLDTSLAFRTCSEMDQRSCKRSDLVLPPQP
ncbi:ribonuclease T2 family protein [Rhizobium wuzhouense]|uniref:Ribonuclease T(2) n=1 Tax=Rhizobium wuzhouense TaxID=1986026 RepID=A0ABX5NNU3_9HYPH|nr:ribonuclease T(2) [Rhizobium wuzhouense]PYB70826.1 ribonuclease T(2) [Rhizobium wuzhouense]